jgi:hypothetical protein
MRSRTTRSLFTATALASSIIAGQPAVAAPPPVAGFIGEAASSVPGCPSLLWRLARHPDGTVTGMTYYSDLSGISMVNGSVDQAGDFHLKLTSGMGNGPVGEVTGHRSANGKVDATLKGEGCANNHVVMNPVSTFAGAVGGGG